MIVDEISMLGANFFYMVDMRLRNIKGTEEPFGGCSLFFFGDFYQLPPVADSYIFERPKAEANGYDNIVGSRWNSFEFYELTKVMRQSDPGWSALLNRLRVGDHTADDITRLQALRENSVPEGSVRGCRLVANAETFNADAIDRSSSVKHSSFARDTVQG